MSKPFILKKYLAFKTLVGVVNLGIVVLDISTDNFENHY